MKLSLDYTSIGLLLIMSLKWPAHSLQGKYFPNRVIIVFISSYSSTVGISGTYAEYKCITVQTKKPALSLSKRA